MVQSLLLGVSCFVSFVAMPGLCQYVQTHERHAYVLYCWIPALNTPRLTCLRGSVRAALSSPALSAQAVVNCAPTSHDAKRCSGGPVPCWLPETTRRCSPWIPQQVSTSPARLWQYGRKAMVVMSLSTSCSHARVLHGEGRISPTTPRSQNNDQPSRRQTQEAVQS